METKTISRQEPPLNLDVNARKNFINFHAKLDTKPKTTIRFFDRTDLYTVHDDDCEIVAKIVYNSTAFIHHLLEDNLNSLTYVALSKFNFEMALRELLLVRNYRVEVYQKRATGNDWHVEYRGSPGNLLQFEDILFTNKEVLVTNMILSIQMRTENSGSAGEAQRKIGIASVDQNECLFQLVEFIDDDFYRELEATIVLLSPKECLLPSIDNEYAAVKAVLDRNDVMVTVPKKITEAEKGDVIQDLNRLLRFNKGQEPNAKGLPELNLNIAVGALQSVIKYLDLITDESNLGRYELKQINLKRFVHLNGAAVSALNILPKPGTALGPARRQQSILGVLDHCRTPQGHRLLMQWIKQPLRNLDLINDRHNIVQCLLEAPTSLSTLHEDYMKRIPDILMLTKKLMRHKATLQDLFRVYHVLLRAPIIFNTLQALENSTVKSMLCDPLQSHLEDLNGLKQMVEQVMDFEAIKDGEYLVKASIDEELNELNQRMSKLHAKMEAQRAQAVVELNLERDQQVRLDNVTHLGYHFRVVARDETALRKNKKFTIIDVVKGGVRFTTDKMKEYSDAYTDICTQYKNQQKSVVDEIINVALGYAAPLMSLNYELAQLDCLLSFAIAAQTAPTPYVRPKMLDEGAGILKLKDLRHPCLEVQEHITYIANDLIFEKDICNMRLITGPNMGGKSTYIRSIGAAVLMAHIGAFVPCSEATITIVDCILGRIGSNDNVTKGLSTFMVEMIETAGIIRAATENSLVIIDELGRGTSTYEGCGIAWSIAENLAKNVKCFTLFATHFHEITQLANTVSTVQNCHMAAVADKNHFTLLYQVRPGVMEKSFGIQVAQLADFPTKVIKDAQTFYKEYEDEYADKKSDNDNKILANINDEIEKLKAFETNDATNDDKLNELFNNFRREIKKCGKSDYFEAICNEIGNKIKMEID